MKGKPIRFTLLALLLLSVASAAIGQALNGTISGVVKDPTEAMIPGATVTAVELATNREYKTTTDSGGSFTVAGVPNGFYRVTIESPGFAKYVVERLQVQTSQTSTLTARLALAKTGSEIVVTAEQNTVDVDSPELKMTVSRAQIMNLPLATRNPLDLVRTMPGMATPTSSSDAFVHGLRGNATHITLDGINVADNTVKTSAFFAIVTPNVDTTGEFNVSTGAIGTDAGAGATQVSMRTNRGSNDFHGGLYWYQRTGAFGANNWFNNAVGAPKPYQLQNRIGAQAGGPVSIPGIYDGKNRSWVFGNFEIFREPRQQARTRTVMTAGARTGTYTYVPICTAVGVTPATTDDCAAGITPGVARTVNLLTLGTVNGGVAAISPATMDFYNRYVPTTGLSDSGCTSDTFNIRCLRRNLSGKSINDRYVIRGDHQLTKSNSIEFVYTRLKTDTSPDFLNGIEPHFVGTLGGGQDSKRELYVWAWQSTIGSRMTNELRAGITRAPVNFRMDNDFSETGGFQIDYTTVTDVTLVTTNLPQGRNTPVRQIMDNFSWVQGRHAMRFGGEYQWIASSNYFFNTVVPRAIIGTNSANQNGLDQSLATCTGTGCDFAGGISSGDFGRAGAVFNNITGLVNSVTQGFNHTSASSGFVPREPRLTTPVQATTAAYFSDSFKWKPNFTLQFGVRWEYQGVFDLRNQLILQPTGDTLQGLWGPSAVNSFFTPSGTPVQSDVLMDFAGGRNGRPIYTQDENNFAPFLGFAWDPWKDGKTSIRGGGSAHFTQDGFTVGAIASTGNTGLFVVRSACNTAGPNCTAAGVTTGGLNLAQVPVPAVPVAAFPVSQAANFRDAGAALWVFEPNLRNPYVLEWTLSVQREMWKRITFEARYVGNHAVKQLRSYSLNELNLQNSPFTCVTRAAGTLGPDNLGQTDPGLNCGTANGVSAPSMLQEFANAQSNLAICTANRVACTGSATGALRFNNAGVAGQVEVPIFTALFSGVAASSGFQNATFVTNLQQNAIGSLFGTLRNSNTYLRNRNFDFPLNFFVANPWAGGANLVSNAGWSYYHGLEMEVRRRFSTGLFFQANYTFAKVLTDVRFLTSQQESQNYLSLNNGKADKNRAAFDITHSLRGNFIYALPFGRGKWLGANASPAMDKFIGGWSITGVAIVQSGTPFNITSPRNVLGSGETATGNIRNMTADQLQSNIGVFYRPEGVYWLNPDSGLMNITGTTSRTTQCARSATGQLTTTTPCFEHPFTNQNGNLPFFGLNGPMVWNQDFSIIKRTNIPSVSEQFNFEIRFEIFNLMNHPNFGGLSNGLDDSDFGRYTSQVDTARGGGVTGRLVQWAIRLNW